MKIGIYTIFKSSNFGAQLQAYATQEFLRANGFESEIVNYSPQSIENTFFLKYPWTNLKGFFVNLYILTSPQIWMKKKRLNRFQKRLSLSKKYSNASELYRDPPVYDVHLVGSDQVWNVEMENYPFFFIPFISNDSLKMSYASSFGSVRSAILKKNDIANYLKTFTKISVREFSAKQFLSQECAIEAQDVLDPTFLLSQTDWNRISKGEPLIQGDYILYYGFNGDIFTSELIRYLRKKKNMPVVGVSVSVHSPYQFDRFYLSAGPEEFLNLVRYSSYIITSSFHGVAFSLIYKKEFAVVPLVDRMSRMISLLQRYNLLDRIVNDIKDIDDLRDINYTLCENNISHDIVKSQNWLISSLSSS